MYLVEFLYFGYIEYLIQKLGSKESLMFMVNDDLCIGVVINYIVLKEVVFIFFKDFIVQKICLMNNCLKMDFGIECLMIVVLGLNLYVSDNGVFGQEEEELIRFVVVECKKKGVMVMGLFVVDGFFGLFQFMKFDGILVMYYD